MVTAEELTVAIQSEGVGETRQDLEGVESAMQDTAESAGESAEQLEGFSERFAGAMSAAVAALAVGAAGLLSQVPVLGESFAGLAAIVDALAFQMDGVLRPVLSPLTNAFYGIANAIFEADGAAGDIIGGVTTLASVALAVIPAIAKLGSMLGTWPSMLAGISSILSTIGSAFVSVGSAIAGFVSGSIAAAAAVGALLGVLAVAALEVTGVLAAIREFGSFVGTALPPQIRDGLISIIGIFGGALLGTIGGLISGFVSGFLEGGLSEGIDQAVQRARKVLDIFFGAWSRTLANITQELNGFTSALSDVREDIMQWATTLSDAAFNWGKNLIQGFLSGIRSALSDLQEVLGSLRDVGATVGIDVPSFDGLGGGGSGSGGGGGGSGRPRFGTSGSGGTRLDGRQLTESTGRYRSDPGRRRGL